MRSAGTGFLLICQIPQARTSPVSPRDSSRKDQPSLEGSCSVDDAGGDVEVDISDVDAAAGRRRRRHHVFQKVGENLESFVL